MSFFPQFYFVPFTVDDGYVDVDLSRLDRIYAQYRNKPKAVSWYNIVYTEASQIAETSEIVRASYDIDYASGQMLDVIGNIVVVTREFIANVPLYPGLFADPDGDEFGDTEAMFSALNVNADANMADDLFRLVIKSKIIKNNGDATIDNILKGMNFLLPNANVLRLIDNEDMSFNIEFYGVITELERWALLNSTLVPKPQGVRFNGFLEAAGYVEAGDDTMQFGDSTAEFTGLTGV